MFVGIGGISTMPALRSIAGRRGAANPADSAGLVTTGGCSKVPDSPSGR